MPAPSEPDCPTSAPRARFIALAIGLLASVAQAQTSPDFSDLDTALASSAYGPVRSLVIQRGDELLHEGYYRGFARDDLQLLNSVTKSVGATLIGMAQRRGLLEVDAPLAELLPQYDWNSIALRDKRDISLANILSMRHGLDWDEWSTGFLDPVNPAAQMFASPDWYAYTLQRPRVSAPDQQFAYSTGTSTLMSGVLRRATGGSVEDLFRDWLADPLGIGPHRWELWSPNGPGTGRTVFPNGDVPLGVGLWLRPRDLAKLGQLYLQDGIWNGRRLLDREWIDASWSLHNSSANDAYFQDEPERTGYGYQWWFIELEDARGRRVACWYANGAGRQYLFVCPLLDLVLVSTADAYAYSGAGIVTLMRERILPRFGASIRSDLSGTWHDPARSGQGVTLEVHAHAGTVTLGWYTYASGSQRWYFGSGRIEGDRVVFDALFRTEAGEFLSMAPPQVLPAGSATLYWSDCNSATLEFQLDAASGTYALTRLTGECSR